MIIRIRYGHAQKIVCYHDKRIWRRNSKKRKKSYAEVKLNSEVNLGISSIKCVESVVRGKCDGCFLDRLTLPNNCRILVGACNGKVRSDRKDVIFVKTTFTLQEVINLLEWIRGKFDIENKEWLYYAPLPMSSGKVIEEYLENYKIRSL